MKVSSEAVDVILVGGSIILPKTLAGTGKVYAPDHFGCANAIGSVISKVSGSFEQLMDYDQIPREQARTGAVKLAVEAGAVEDTLEECQRGWHEGNDDPTPFIKCGIQGL